MNDISFNSNDFLSKIQNFKGNSNEVPLKLLNCEAYEILSSILSQEQLNELSNLSIYELIEINSYVDSQIENIEDKDSILYMISWMHLILSDDEPSEEYSKFNSSHNRNESSVKSSLSSMNQNITLINNKRKREPSTRIFHIYKTKDKQAILAKHIKENINSKINSQIDSSIKHDEYHKGSDDNPKQKKITDRLTKSEIKYYKSKLQIKRSDPPIDKKYHIPKEKEYLNKEEKQMMKKQLNLLDLIEKKDDDQKNLENTNKHSPTFGQSPIDHIQSSNNYLDEDYYIGLIKRLVTEQTNREENYLKILELVPNSEKEIYTDIIINRNLSSVSLPIEIILFEGKTKVLKFVVNSLQNIVLTLTRKHN